MGFSPQSNNKNQDFRDVSATKQQRLGEVAETWNGKRYRYSLMGAVDGVVGKVYATPASTANHVNQAVAAAVAVGATKVTVTVGATAAVQDLYLDGELEINAAAGAGQSYVIKGHPAVAASGTISLRLEDPVKVALTTSSKASLRRNPWAAIVLSTVAAARAAGVPNVVIPAANYGWVQTRGDAQVLSDGVIAAGTGAVLSGSVNGAIVTEAAASITKRVANAGTDPTVDTEYRTVNLAIE